MHLAQRRIRRKTRSLPTHATPPGVGRHYAANWRAEFWPCSRARNRAHSTAPPRTTESQPILRPENPRATRVRTGPVLGKALSPRATDSSPTASKQARRHLRGTRTQLWSPSGPPGIRPDRYRRTTCAHVRPLTSPSLQSMPTLGTFTLRCSLNRSEVHDRCESSSTVSAGLRTRKDGEQHHHRPG